MAKDDDDYYELKRVHDDNKKRNEQKYKDFSKKRLVDTVTGRMRTMMIGNLAIIEKTIGHLWAINEKRPLTPDEEEMLDMWTDIRTQILDLGNNNIRITEEEMSRYTVNWNRYQYEMKDIGDLVKRRNKNENF